MIGTTHREPRRGTTIVLAVVALALLAGLAWGVPDSSAQRDQTRTVPAKPCRVGEIDRESLNPNPYGGQHPFSVAPTIVGCGHSSFGRVKLVAYDITRPAEFCFGVVVPRLGVMSGGECKPQNESWTALGCPSGFCSFGPDFGVGGGPKYGFQATIVSGVATIPLKGIEVVGGRVLGNDDPPRRWEISRGIWRQSSIRRSRSPYSARLFHAWHRKPSRLNRTTG